MFEKSLDVNNITDKLHRACATGDLDLVKSLIESGYDIEISNSSGWTPLIYASRFGNLEIVNYLIYNGANIEVRVDVDGLHSFLLHLMIILKLLNTLYLLELIKM